MSFWTSFHYYRPTRPPVVTGPALATFVRDLAATGSVEPGFMSLSVKFGKRIDRDDKPTSREVEIYPRCYVYRDIRWDIRERDPIDVLRMADLLDDQDRPIYRAELSLGAVPERIWRPLMANREDGDTSACFHSWWLQLAPVESASLDSDGTFEVGWMSLGLSGPGYLSPLTPSELVRRATGVPELHEVTELCRRTWPVDPEWVPGIVAKLTPVARRHKVRQFRGKMGGLWPYDSLDEPWDWYWGVAESG